MCGFLFAYWDVFDCFSGKAGASDLKERQCFWLFNIIFRNGMASAFPLKQLLLILWQIKNHTLAGLLILWVEKMAYTLGKSTTHKAIFSTHKINAKTSDLTTKLLKPL